MSKYGYLIHQLHRLKKIMRSTAEYMAVNHPDHEKIQKHAEELFVSVEVVKDWIRGLRELAAKEMERCAVKAAYDELFYGDSRKATSMLRDALYGEP